MLALLKVGASTLVPKLPDFYYLKCRYAGHTCSAKYQTIERKHIATNVYIAHRVADMLRVCVRFLRLFGGGLR